MEDNLENEYIVTDENGCATDPSIFGEWDYNPDTNTLMANFNAFKFPSSDNIRFQCNIRVCFGKCQPVNCRGFNAYGRRRRREITDESQIPNKSVATRSINDDLGLEGSLREEITISSNAILTFEKRDGRYSNSDNRKFYCVVKIKSIFNPHYFSQTRCPASWGHLRLNDWINHCPHHHSFASARCCCYCSILLVNGLSQKTKVSQEIFRLNPGCI